MKRRRIREAKVNDRRAPGLGAEAVSAENPTRPVPCFIGGAGRTGKTSLKGRLMAYPRAGAFRGESRIYADPDGILSFLRILENRVDPYEYDMAAYRLSRILCSAGGPRWVANVAWRRRELDEQTFMELMLRIEQRFRRKPYSTLSLRQEIPEYDLLLGTLLSALGTRYRGRWIGMEPRRKSVMTLPPADPDEVRHAVVEFADSVIRGVVWDRPNATHVLDDTPYTALRFNEMLSLFPGAKLVYMHRQDSDVVNATIGRKWAPKHPDTARELTSYVGARWRAERELLPAGTFYELSYEEFAREPDECAESVARFLGLGVTD